jgi:hypothetical protein
MLRPLSSSKNWRNSVSLASSGPPCDASPMPEMPALVVMRVRIQLPRASDQA